MSAIGGKPTFGLDLRNGQERTRDGAANLGAVAEFTQCKKHPRDPRPSFLDYGWVSAFTLQLLYFLDMRVTLIAEPRSLIIAHSQNL
jgi:hypothetical protein